MRWCFAIREHIIVHSLSNLAYPFHVVTTHRDTISDRVQSLCHVGIVDIGKPFKDFMEYVQTPCQQRN